ncbi:MAG TPA: glycosyltransferase family 2 protein [Candidatus Woesebacteria bacterium]|nr:glycosyltransferase family 2 protein [Candidatus Woesebacteria bacterium]
MSTSKKSIIIINYNSSENTNNLLISIKKNIYKYINEIIIIDNNSKDIKKLNINDKKIRLIKNKKNFGFAKAVNQGINKSKNNLLILLNPDTTIINDSILTTISLIENDKNIGVIGGKIKYKNKDIFTANNVPTFFTGLFEFTNLKKIFPNNKYTLNFWPEKSKKIMKPINVYGVCGAYLIFKKYDKKGNINYFNEDYFLYLEDLDFCLKMRKKGYKVIFDPRSEILHLGGASSQNIYNMALNHWYKSRKIFFKKHLNKLEGIILNIIFTIEELFLKIRLFIKP